MPKTVTKFTISKATDIPAKPLLDERGNEIWYNTRPEAEKALNKLEDKKDYTIVEQKSNVE